MNKCWLLVFSFLLSFSLLAQTTDHQTGNWGDQGDGTFRNPILPSDYSDPDVIRVGSDYYLISSISTQLIKKNMRPSVIVRQCNNTSFYTSKFKLSNGLVIFNKSPFPLIFNYKVYSSLDEIGLFLDFR